MKIRFIDITAELKNTRSSWKMKVIAGIVLEYDNDDKKVDTKIFIHSINDQTIMLQIDSNVLVDDMIKSLSRNIKT